ncbi:MAG: GNAT family N-acetyltransferase [Bryobacterales bacterium]|nr:GNAT family N-acetyltransferase [Bryobacterales bacterium]
MISRSSFQTRAVGEVRDLLEQDPYWALYALGDLDAERFPHARWMIEGRSIALLYEQFEVPILFVLGEPDGLARAVPDRMYLQVRETVLDRIRETHAVEPIRPAIRMRLEEGAFRPVCVEECERLTAADLAEVEQLYQDGLGTGESPDFFYPSMLEEGVFVGCRRDGRLVAVAGTHLIGRTAGVAAIGNIYTHRSYRRRGLGAQVTTGVVKELLRMGIRRIGLNVYEANEAAQRVYRELGFVEHSRYFEGAATRYGSHPDGGAPAEAGAHPEGAPGGPAGGGTVPANGR